MSQRSGMMVEMEKEPRVNPICFVCLKAILRREARYRRGLGSVHVECEKTTKGRAPGPEAERPPR